MSKAVLNKARKVAQALTALELDVDLRESKTETFIDSWLTVKDLEDVQKLIEFFTGEQIPPDDAPASCRTYWTKARGKWVPKRFPGNRTPKAGNRRRIHASYRSTYGPVQGARTWLVDVNGNLRDGSHGLLGLYDYFDELTDQEQYCPELELNFRICTDDRIWSVIDQGVPRSLADMLEVRGLGVYAKSISTATNNAVRLLSGDKIGGGNRPKFDIMDGHGKRELLPSEIEGRLIFSPYDESPAEAGGGVLNYALDVLSVNRKGGQYIKLPAIAKGKIKGLKETQMPYVILGVWTALAASHDGKLCGFRDDIIGDFNLKLSQINDPDHAPAWLIKAIAESTSSDGKETAVAAISSFLQGLPKIKKSFADCWTEAYAKWSEQFELEEAELEMEDDDDIESIEHELAETL